MDPVECLRAMAIAVVDGDTDVAAERAEDLSGWIDQGGFLPPGVEGLGETNWKVSNRLREFADILRNLAAVAEAM